MPTISQNSKLEHIGFKATPEFKKAVNIEIARRRSTLRHEATIALSERLGIKVPTGTERKAGASR